MEAAAIVALVALLGFPAAVLLFAAHECAQVPRGLVVPPIRGAAARNAAARAIRRCRACEHEPRCDQLVSERNWSALGAICPNTSFLGTCNAVQS